MLFENASHQFLLSFSDLPLLWVAGGVNGKDPLPNRMNHLENAARFSYRGEAQWKHHNCVVLSIQEQDSNTAVREFWVGIEKDYPIHSCRARNGNNIYWQLEVDYINQDAHLIPNVWSYTGYVRRSKLFYKLTYKIQHININLSIPTETFEKKLEPGMVGFLVEKNTPIEVDRKGGLIPLGAGEARRFSPILLWGVSVFALAIGVYCAWRRLRRGHEWRS